MMHPKDILSKNELNNLKTKDNKLYEKTMEKKKDFFNCYFSIRKNAGQVLFIEKVEFLLQTMSILIDDEFIGFVIKFWGTISESFHLQENSQHKIFKSNLQKLIQEKYIPENHYFNEQYTHLREIYVIKEESEEDNKEDLISLMNNSSISLIDSLGPSFDDY